DDCNNVVDDGVDAGAACTAGLGVCARSGVSQCKADGSGTQCSVSPGPPTAAACDGLDNDCDGITDEPFISATSNLVLTTAYKDIEVAPLYYSAAGCAGGVTGSGTDALAGGMLALAGGTGGLWTQPLDASGNVSGAA